MMSVKLVPGSWFPIPGSRFLVPDSCLPVPASRFPVPGAWFLVSGSRFLLPASSFPVPASLFLVSGSLFPVPCSRSLVPVPQFLVPYSRVTDSQFPMNICSFNIYLAEFIICRQITFICLYHFLSYMMMKYAKPQIIKTRNSEKGTRNCFLEELK